MFDLEHERHDREIINLHVRFDGLELLMSSIQDLSAVVAAQGQQIAALAQLVNALLNKDASNTVLSASDQSALDAAEASVGQNTATLQSLAAQVDAVVNPPAPAPEPAPEEAPADGSEAEAPADSEQPAQ